MCADIALANAAGAELRKAGIVPDNCYHFAVSLDAGDAVKLETHCYATGEQWAKIVEIIAAAKKAGRLERGTAIVTNYELSEALEMHTVEIPK